MQDRFLLDCCQHSKLPVGVLLQEAEDLCDVEDDTHIEWPHYIPGCNICSGISANTLKIDEDFYTPDYVPG